MFDNDVGHAVSLSRNVETLMNADVLSAIIPVAMDGVLYLILVVLSILKISYYFIIDDNDSFDNIDLVFLFI